MHIASPVLALVAVAVAACSPPPPPLAQQPAGNAKRGQALLAQYQCGSCHTIPGVQSAGGRAAASLEGFGGRSYIAGRMAMRPDLLAQWVHKPQSLVPQTTMPDMGVTRVDASDMAAYLLELK